VKPHPELRLGRAAAGMVRSEIRGIVEQALRMESPPIRLEIGEPDFATPEHIVEAADRAARDGKVGYTSNAGIGELREALSSKVLTRNDYAAASDQIVVTAGATAGLFSVLRLLADEGDAVLVPDPAWPNYRMMCSILGLEARPYALRPDAGYLPDLDEIARLLDARAKVVVLVSPSNPLGRTLPPETARAIVELALSRGAWVIADEAYDELVFGDRMVSVAAAAPAPNVVSVYSFSKVYAMCGWRVGYVVAPAAVADALAALQEPITSCVNTPAQYGAVAAITGSQAPVAAMRDAYRHRRDVALAELEAQGFDALVPDGAIYLWVDIGSTGLGAREVARRLLEEHHVAVAPGTAFGERGEGSVRLCLASAEASLVEGIRRMGRLNECARTPREKTLDLR
jgi:aspartate aminotransferase